MEATFATFTELHRDTRRVLRGVTERGESVILTEHGRPVAMMVPYQPVRVMVTIEEFRNMVVTDEAILDAIRAAREDEGHFEVEP